MNPWSLNGKSDRLRHSFEGIPDFEKPKCLGFTFAVNSSGQGTAFPDSVAIGQVASNHRLEQGEKTVAKQPTSVESPRSSCGPLRTH